MASVKDYEKRVNETLSTILKHGKLNLHWDTAAEAKIHKASITQLQKQLRLIKKDISLTIKMTNASFQSEKANVGKGFGAAFASGLFGKKSVGSSNAKMKDNIVKRQHATVMPYEVLSRNIDAYITQLDQAKMKLDEWLLTNKK